MRKLRRAARIVFGHSDAPRAPVLVLAGMMPEPPGCGLYLSARGRRTRSAIREYPPGRRPFNERDWRRLLFSFVPSQRRWKLCRWISASWVARFSEGARHSDDSHSIRHGRARPGHPRLPAD